MIQLSPTAITEILRRQSSHAQSPGRFRLRVQPGGCSEFYYHLSFDDAVNADDQTWLYEGIEGVIDLSSLRLVEGLLLDYSEDLMGGGFRFHNPHATQNCGCGNSFAIAAHPSPLTESCS